MHCLAITKLGNMLIGDVVLHACLGVDGKLDPLVNWTSQPVVVLSGI